MNAIEEILNEIQKLGPMLPGENEGQALNKNFISLLFL